MLMDYAKGAKFARMADKERLIDTIPAFRVDEHTSKVIRKVVADDRRNISDVARALLERGVAAYDRDGKLFEPRSEDDGARAANDSQPTIQAASKKVGKRGAAKKRDTA